MSKIYALIIAVETYQDTSIPKVTFAQNDAVEFSNALTLAVLDKNDVELLVNEKATKTAIESKLRTITRNLKSDDKFILYYAGHGYSGNAANFITCHDTVKIINEIEKTSISLQWLFKVIKESDCKKVSLFLDSCHSGLELDTDMRSIFSRMDDQEYKDFCNESIHYMVFSACLTDESSFSSSRHKHGIWTHHLIEAFTGNARDALEKKRFLSSYSLHNYLSAEVPRTLRDVRKGRNTQTPTMWGNMSREFILADLKDVIAQKDSEKSSFFLPPKDLTLKYVEYGSVRSLPGFHSGHRVPTYVSNSTRDFVIKIGMEEIDDEIEQIHTELKKELKYKRKDIKLDKDEHEGVSTLITPDFNYTVYLDIDEEDSSQYIIGKEITEIRNPEIIWDESFGSVFDKHFDELEITMKGSVEIEDIVDALEDNENEELFSLEFPPDLEHCRILLQHFDFNILFESSSITIEFRGKPQIKSILKCCQEIPALFNQIGIMDELPSPEKKKLPQ